MSDKVAIPAAIRWEVWERDDFTCHYCGARQWLGVDHVHAESKGGPLSLDNLVTCCRNCNSRKHARDYGDFRLDGQSLDRLHRAAWRRFEYDRAIARLEWQREVSDLMAHQLLAERGDRYPADAGDRSDWTAGDYVAALANIQEKIESADHQIEGLVTECRDRFGRAPSLDSVSGLSAAD